MLFGDNKIAAIHFSTPVLRQENVAACSKTAFFYRMGLIMIRNILFDGKCRQVQRSKHPVFFPLENRSLSEYIIDVCFNQYKFYGQGSLEKK